MQKIGRKLNTSVKLFEQNYNFWEAYKLSRMFRKIRFPYFRETIRTEIILTHKNGVYSTKNPTISTFPQTNTIQHCNAH